MVGRAVICYREDRPLTCEDTTAYKDVCGGNKVVIVVDVRTDRVGFESLNGQAILPFHWKIAQ